MYFIITSVIIGVVIGSLTNALAIKMLFRPFNAWKIGNLQVPFTPGVIPKRKDEIAEKLGEMVEKYLFTSQGLLHFIEKSNLKEELFNKMMNKIYSYRTESITIEKLLEKLFNKNWDEHIKTWVESKLTDLLTREEIRSLTIEDIVAIQTLGEIDNYIEKFPDFLISFMTDHLHSLEGKRWLEEIINQLIQGKKMLGFIAGFLMEKEQIQQKLILYIEQALNQDKTKIELKKILLKKWYEIKSQPVGVWIDKFEKNIYIEFNHLLDRNIQQFKTMSLNKLIEIIEKQNLFFKLYNLTFKILLKKIDRAFQYLSVSNVVKEEVNRFSLEKLEQMIIQITNKELKMITYFGGILGGIIGLLQGILYLFGK